LRHPASGSQPRARRRKIITDFMTTSAQFIGAGQMSAARLTVARRRRKIPHDIDAARLLVAMSSIAASVARQVGRGEWIRRRPMPPSRGSPPQTF
jgi:hypothetical protein